MLIGGTELYLQGLFTNRFRRSEDTPRSPARRRRLALRPLRGTRASRSHREGQQVQSRASSALLGLSLLLRLELLAEDRRYLTLHERPRHGRVGQRAFLSAWAIHL